MGFGRAAGLTVVAAAGVLLTGASASGRPVIGARPVAGGAVQMTWSGAGGGTRAGLPFTTVALSKSATPKLDPDHRYRINFSGTLSVDGDSALDAFYCRSPRCSPAVRLRDFGGSSAGFGWSIFIPDVGPLPLAPEGSAGGGAYEVTLDVCAFYASPNTSFEKVSANPVLEFSYGGIPTEGRLWKRDGAVYISPTITGSITATVIDLGLANPTCSGKSTSAPTATSPSSSAPKKGVVGKRYSVRGTTKTVAVHTKTMFSVGDSHLPGRVGEHDARVGLHLHEELGG
jgi:hypothetical protein